MRLRVQSYGISKSAKTLANYLEIPRLKTNNSKFRGRQGDLLVNWGCVKKIHQKATYINPITSVAIASDKLATFRALEAAGVSIPTYGTDCSFADDSSVVVARTTLHGHSGQGIEVGTPSEVPHAPLYTLFINKKAEYRAIVCIDEVVDFKQKLKKRDWEEERSKVIWNSDNGYVFARNEIRTPEGINQLAVDAVKALGLKYGAVDIIEDREGSLYVLEINSAFGLEGTTVSLFGDKLKQYITENY